jgi:hypothetical protein
VNPKPSKDRCINYKKSDDEAALFPFRHQGKNHWICAQYLPILIHKPPEADNKISHLV